MLVATDAGHGRETSGKRTPPFPDGSIMKENTFNKAVVGYLIAELERNGFQTVNVAPETIDTALSVRTTRANNAGADIYISVHANAFGDGWNDANGIETLVYRVGDNGQTQLAKLVQAKLIAETGLKDRGVKERTDLAVLRETKMPAILCECGFMTNRNEADLLRSDDYRRKVARAICKGVCAYYGKKYIPEVTEVADKRYNTVEELPYGKDTVQSLIDNGALSGDEKGNLDLSKDMLRVLMIVERMMKLG